MVGMKELWQGKCACSNNNIIPTQNRDYNNCEIKHIPGLLEVVMTESYQFQNALEREDDDKGQVDIMDYIGKRLFLLEMFHRHRENVEHDNNHNGNIKLLVCRQIVTKSRQPKLQNKTSSFIIIIIMIFIISSIMSKLYASLMPKSV